MQTHRSIDVWSVNSPQVKMYYHKSTVPVLTHNHDFFEIIYFVHGDGVHTINAVDYPLEAGCISYIDQYVSHAIRYNGVLEYYDILIGRPILKMIGFDTISDAIRRLNVTTEDKNTKIAPMLYLYQEDAAEIWSLVKIMYSELNKKKQRYLDIVTELIKILLIRISRSAGNSSARMTMRDPDSLKQNALDYVLAHVNEPIFLHEIAEKYSYNPSYFSRFFKQHYGMNFTDFVSKKRIENAIELMKSTTLSIEKISQSVGYQSKSQFYRTFKRVTGQTVSDFLYKREEILKSAWKRKNF